MASERNRPCICGSGKKFKRCCALRKPISRSFVVEWETPTVVEGVRIGPNGEVEFLSAGRVLVPKRSWTELSRERAKSQKMLSRIPNRFPTIGLDEFRALAAYDRVFAIDTNTVSIEGIDASISSFFECIFRKDGRIDAIERGFFRIVGKRPKEREKLGWMYLIKIIQQSPDFKPSSIYGVISDADLGNHDSYNQQKAEYQVGVMIPINFKIIYASSEGGELASKILRRCDRIAKNGLGRLRAAKGRVIEPIKNIDTHTTLVEICVFDQIPENDGWMKL